MILLRNATTRATRWGCGYLTRRLQLGHSQAHSGLSRIGVVSRYNGGTVTVRKPHGVLTLTRGGAQHSRQVLSSRHQWIDHFFM
jgi:hypothetical protein